MSADDMLVAERPHFVYRLYDAADTLLYIGCTRDVPGRLYHLTALCNLGKSPNGDLQRRGIARHTATEYPNRRAALDAERAAIKAELPLLNVQSKPRARSSP